MPWMPYADRASCPAAPAPLKEFSGAPDPCEAPERPEVAIDISSIGLDEAVQPIPFKRERNWR